MRQPTAAEYEQLREENRRLRFTNEMTIIAAGRGITGVIDEAYNRVRRLEQQLDDVAATATDLRERLDEQYAANVETAPALARIKLLPDGEALNRADESDSLLLNWGEACVVEGRVWVLYGPDTTQQLEVGIFPPCVFAGSVESAKNELLAAVQSALRRTPIDDDIRGSIVGLSRENILEIVNDLSVYWHVRSKSDFNARRQMWFDKFHQQMKKANAGIGITKGRNDIHTNFNNVINRTLEAADVRMRRDKYQPSKQGIGKRSRR